MLNRRWELSAESITAIAAVVAALIALAVGVWENVQERYHNRLSVFPHLALIAELHTTEHPDSTDRAVIRIINEGVGPAIIDEVRIRVRDPDGTEHRFDSWGAAREALERWGVQVGGRAEFGEGTVMGVGREFSMLTLTAPENLPDGPDHPFFRLLDQLEVAVTYQSIYGDEYRSAFGEEE